MGIVMNTLDEGNWREGSYYIDGNYDIRDGQDHEDAARWAEKFVNRNGEYEFLRENCESFAHWCVRKILKSN